MKILFYSNKCNYCLKLLNIINQLKNNDIKLICVDNNTKIPSNLEKVPTLIIPDINEPLVGNKAFNWIELQSKTNNLTHNINFSEKVNDDDFKHSDKLEKTFNNSNKNDEDDGDIDDYIDYEFLEKINKEKEQDQNNKQILNKDNQQSELNKMVNMRNTQINTIFFNNNSNPIDRNNNGNIKRSNLN